MREPGGVSGMTGHGGDEANGSECRGGVRDSEAGGGHREYSCLVGAGDWNAQGASEGPDGAD